MFHNIANTSTFTSALMASLLTVEQVKAWSQDDVKTFLQGNRTRLDLEDEDINKIYTQRVKGSTFLDFTAVDFERWEVLGSPAKEIEKLINEIKGEQLGVIGKCVVINLVNASELHPVLPTKSIENAINEAKSLFEQNSQDLIKVATNEYEPYSHFKASDKNKYKQIIDNKCIPMLNGEPNLLLHNLPEQDEKGLTDYDSFKSHIKEISANSIITVILGTSGCGKTRLCFEALCHNYGLYLVAFPYSIGSIDLELSARWTKDNINGQQPKVAENLAERAVMSCIVGRLLLLQHLFHIAERRSITMMPKSWLILQLRHTIIKNLYLKFQNVTDLASIKLHCRYIMEDIENKLTETFPIVYDEAQSHTTYLLATFPSARLSQERARPFFSVVVRSLSNLCYLYAGAIVCITGSGLSLLRARDEISSRGKDELHVPTFTQFGQIETSAELLGLARSILPLKDDYASLAINWLKGRYCWSWTWINYLIKSEFFNPEEQLRKLIENLTTDAKNLPNREYSIYTGFADLEKYPPVRPTSINSVFTLELVKRAIIVHAMTGKPIMFTSTEEMDIMSLGFAHIKHIQNFTSIIDEPLVIQAGLNFFENNNPNNMWLQMMAQANFNTTILGFIWKKCIINFLREKLFESNTTLSESEIFPDYQYLPDDLYTRPSKLLPYDNKCIGQIAVECTTADNYIEWLRAVAEWEKTGNIPENFCPICYLPNTAGPDISIAFYCSRAENDMQLNEKRESYIINVQVKLRKNAMVKQSFKTAEPIKMFIDKNGTPNPPGANELLCKIYKEQEWSGRNIKIIVVYPCNPKRTKEYLKTPGRNRIIPKVIIGEENANILFPQNCQEWIKEFKSEDWDCSDVED